MVSNNPTLVFRRGEFIGYLGEVQTEPTDLQTTLQNRIESLATLYADNARYELGGDSEALAGRLVSVARALRWVVDELPRIVVSNTYAHSARENPIESLIEESEGN